MAQALAEPPVRRGTTAERAAAVSGHVRSYAVAALSLHAHRSDVETAALTDAVTGVTDVLRARASRVTPG